ncbi:MAG: hypothetical protein C0446_14195 [Chitinophaga sp.]|nr:hypothetical protein [Chitinophaga sp.]
MIQAVFAVSALNDEALDTAPTVWRSVSQSTMIIHKQLQEKLHASPSAEPHNRAIATLYHLNQQGKWDVIDLPFESGEVYKSNHVYSYKLEASSDVGADTTESINTTSQDPPPLRKHRTEISKEHIEKGFKGARTKIPENGIKQLKSGMPVEDAKNCTEVEKYLTELIQQFENLKQATSELKTLREVEADYLKNYPFAKHYKNRMRDSEVSICRDIDDTIRRGNKSPQRLNKINLHIHSDNNPCFCCVQTIHFYAKKWIKDCPELELLIFVSSDKEYVWSGSLTDEHIVPNNSVGKPSMREYGRDDKYDLLLDIDELKRFTYSTQQVGKVIQIFMPLHSAVTVEAAVDK